MTDRRCLMCSVHLSVGRRCIRVVAVKFISGCVQAGRCVCACVCLSVCVGALMYLYSAEAASDDKCTIPYVAHVGCAVLGVCMGMCLCSRTKRRAQRHLRGLPERAA